jgi:hypothetical protein
MQRQDLVPKIYEDFISPIRDSLKDRKQWVWYEDVDVAYEQVAKATAIEVS